MRLVTIIGKTAWAKDPYDKGSFPLRGKALGEWVGLERARRAAADLGYDDLVGLLVLEQDKVIAKESDRTRYDPKYKRIK